MTAWTAFRRFGIGAFALTVLFASESRATDPEPTLPDPAQLRARAGEAERAGDWDTAFTLYCHLYIADRSAPDLREKLANSLRRVQQLRRHRDPAFMTFLATLPQGDALNLFAEVMNKVPRGYADPNRATHQALWANGVEELDRALGNPVFQATFLNNVTPSQIEAFRTSLRTDWARRPVTNAREARATLKLLVNDAQDRCPLRNPSAAVIEVICGACAGLDEYTVYLSPTTVVPDPVPSDLSDYGIYLNFADDGARIDGVAAGSWAAFNTTLRKGDRVIRINGRPLAMNGPAAVADALRQPIGMFHEIETAPSAPDMLAGVSRLPLTVPSVYTTRLLSSKDGVGYIRVGSIQTSTPREVEQAVSDLRAAGARVLILDLRDNHGGNFLAGVELAKRFLPAGVIVTTQGQRPEVANVVFSSDSGMNAIDIPLVVMVDTETASAAEVVAAALKDNNRATLVGMPTFGKGAIQYPLKLGALDDPADPTRAGVRSGSVRLTIARLIAPRGTPINGIGVTPHVIEPDPRCQDDMAIQRAIDLIMPPRP